MEAKSVVKLTSMAVLLVAAAATAAAAQAIQWQCGPGCAFNSLGIGLADDVVITGSTRNAWLGVHLADVTAEKMAELKLKEEYGAIVTEVEEESPAAKAGLKANDVILSYQGERVESAAQLARLVRETPAGRVVRVQLSRDGRPQTLSVTLERRELMRHSVRMPKIRIPSFDFEILGSRPRLGISADELTPQLATYFGVKQGKGVLVREVNAGSAAEKAGLKAGDVIVRIDDDSIEDVGDLRRALGKKKGGESATLGIVRDRAETSLRVQLEETVRRSRDSAFYFFDDPEEFDQEMGESLRELKRELREQERHQQERNRLRDFERRLRELPARIAI